MERKSVLDKVKAFLNQVSQNDPTPVPLELSDSGPYIEMDLGLGIYEIKDTRNLKFDGTGTLIPELLEKDTEPVPLIEEILNTKKNKD